MINQILHGDNIELMKQLEDNSVDAIVTDPPYGLSFMNKKWDYDVPKIEFWQAVYRVLKPGGHVLSFGGTRTYHRMVVNLEDAGFVIRDCIVWGFGSGFPKGVNIGKAIDNKLGNERELVLLDKHYDGAKRTLKRQTENKNVYGDYKDITYIDGKVPDSVGTSEYEGWNTGLKPAVELICLARKPISENTIVDNVLKWGTGGINIDGCRIETSENENIDYNKINNGNIYGGNGIYGECENKRPPQIYKTNGRFPSNFIHDGSDEVMELFPMTGKSTGGNGSKFVNSIFYNNRLHIKVHVKTGKNGLGLGDSGSAARYFYCAKPSPKERNLGMEGFEKKQIERLQQLPDGFISSYGNIRNKPLPQANTHLTVKPISLLKYLIRLITPPNGVVLDPFCGSGTTICAAILENKNYIGMELENDYYEIAKAREKYFLNGGKL